MSWYNMKTKEEVIKDLEEKGLPYTVIQVDASGLKSEQEWLEWMATQYRKLRKAWHKTVRDIANGK